jgi:hypothetical protein
MNTTSPVPSLSIPHDDGLEWLRTVRRNLMAEAGGDLRRLGNRYRETEAKQPEKVADPRQLLTDAVHSMNTGQGASASAPRTLQKG